MAVFRHSLNGVDPRAPRREPIPPPAALMQADAAPAAPAAMLVTAKVAARMLSIGERTLWTLTARGEIPVVKAGRAVRYDVEDLRAWIRRAKHGGPPPDGGVP